MTSTPSTFALEQNPLLLNPQLAAAIGVDEAIVLGQFHYWLSKGCGLIVDGIRWIFNTYQQWLEQFPFFSLHRFRKALANLIRLGLVRFEKLKASQWNQTGHYTIDYERLKPLQLSICEQFTNPFVNSPQIDLRTAHKSGTETTPETTAKTTATAAAILTEEGSKSTSLATLEDQARLTNVRTEDIYEGDSSAAAASSIEEILDAVDDAGIETNPQLRSLLLSYTLEQVKSSIDHYRVTKQKKAVSNPAGWLVECLRGQWWSNEATAEEMARATAGKWVNWARSKGLIDYSLDDARITGYPAGVRCCIGHATGGQYEPWEEVAKRHPLSLENCHD